MSPAAKKGFSIRNLSEGECEIYLYDVIDQWGGISARDVQRELKAAGDNIRMIHVRINSPGGSVWDGMAIYSMLRSHKARKIVHIDGLAASMASAVAMAGDEVEMPSNAFIMIHNPADFVGGDSEEMRKSADLLDQVKAQIVGMYARKTGQSAEKISELMNEETWMSGEDALQLKFCDRCVDALATAASCDPARLTAYKNVPGVFNRFPVTQPQGAIPMATESVPAVKAATLKELKAACPGADEKFLCSQLEAEATVAVASATWLQAQADQIKALRDELVAAKAARPGVDPARPNGKNGKKAGDSETEDEDEPEDMIDLQEPIEAFDRLVTKEVKAQIALGSPADRMKAVMQVANKNPELHQAYLVASSGGGKRAQRLVEEKFEQMPSFAKK